MLFVIFSKTTIKRFYQLCVLSLALASCASSGKALKEVSILSQNSHQKTIVSAEIAADDASRMQGLMFRKVMGKKEGMIFLFPSDSRMPFWMENTYLPLDIVFISADHRIVDIAENTKPLSEDLIQSKQSYRYVLEVNAGFTNEHQIKVGDKVEF